MKEKIRRIAALTVTAMCILVGIQSQPVYAFTPITIVITPNPVIMPCNSRNNTVTVKITGTITLAEDKAQSFEVRLVDEDSWWKLAWGADDVLGKVTVTPITDGLGRFNRGQVRTFTLTFNLNCVGCTVTGLESSGETVADLAVEIDSGRVKVKTNHYDTKTGKPVPAECSDKTKAQTKSEDFISLKVGMQGQPTTLNPFQAQSEWDWHVLHYFYEGLVTYRPKDFEVVPNIALEVPEVTADNLEYYVTLRDDVYWSDGVQVTAHDFALFGEIVKEFQIGRYLPSWEFVESVEAVDDFTLRFVLSECRVTFVEGTLMSLCIPSHIWKPKLAEFRADENPTKALQEYQPIEPDEIISCGSFIFQEWERGSFVKSVKNDNYFGTGHLYAYDDGMQLTVGPYVDNIIYRIYDTTDAAILGLKEGEIDYIWWAIQPGYVSDLLEDPNITVTNNPENGMRYMAFNCQKEPFNDLAFRQAVATMIDRDFIRSRVLQNYGEALYTCVPPGNREWYNPNVIMWGRGFSREERIEEAVRILKASGNYSWDVEPGVDEDGSIIEGEGVKYKGKYIEPFVILTPPADYDPLRAMSGMLIQELLRQIGLPVTAQPTAFGTIVQKAMGERDYDMYILGWSLTIYPDYLRDFFHSSQIMEYGYNIPQYSNPQFDRLADELVTCGPREDKIQVAFSLQENLAEELPYVPLFAQAVIEAYRNDRYGGWFDQLDGIDDSLIYIKPIEAPKEMPEEEGGLCLGTCFVALAVFGGSVFYFKRRP